MVKISNRLKSLVPFVRDDDYVMDVGCDHALLDIYLVQNNILNKIYVCDVNPNALQNGIDNIKNNGLEENVIPVLGYGIEKIGDINVDTLIISGMGSKNIISILESPNLNKIYKLILQSNNNHYELRKFLVSKEFSIVYEEIIPDGKKTYINIIAGRERFPKKYTEEELEFGPVLIKDKNNIDYFRDLKEKYTTLYEKSRTNEMKNKIEILDKIIEDLSSL